MGPNIQFQVRGINRRAGTETGPYAILLIERDKNDVYTI